METWRHDMGHEETLEVWWWGIHPLLCFYFFRVELKMKCEEEKWMEKKSIRVCLFAVDSVGLLSMEKKERKYERKPHQIH